MAILNISSYKQYNNNGQLVLILETTGNHNIKTKYTDIQISGATNSSYNGIFRFFIINNTTLEYRQEIYESSPILTKPTVVAGTIVADTISYTTLTPQNLATDCNLYTINVSGNYQIALDPVNIYKIIYSELAGYQMVIGERLNDTDRILYAQDIPKPISIYKSKWLMLEVSNLSQNLEVRLVKLN